MSKEPEIRRLVVKAHKMHREDAELAAVCARKGAEAICSDVFARRLQKQPGLLMLDELIRKLLQDGAIPRIIAIQLHTIQAFGNYYVHVQSETSSQDPASLDACMAALDGVTAWYYREHCATDVPEEFRAARVASTEAPVVASGSTASSRHAAIESTASLCDVLVADREVFLWFGDDTLWLWGERGPQLIEAGPSAPLCCACVDRRELFVASADGVIGLYSDHWKLIAGERPVLALTRFQDGVLAADVDGRIRRVDLHGHSTLLASVHGMLVDLQATHAGVVGLDASGNAWCIAQHAGRGSLSRVDMTALGGRAWTLVPDPTEASVAIASAHTVARIDLQLGTLSRSTTALVDEIRQVVIVDEQRLLVLTDGGDLWGWDGRIWEPMMLPRHAKIASIAAAGRGRALIVTSEGDAFSLGTNRAMTSLGARVMAARGGGGDLVLVRAPTPGVLVVERRAAS